MPAGLCIGTSGSQQSHRPVPGISEHSHPQPAPHPPDTDSCLRWARSCELDQDSLYAPVLGSLFWWRLAKWGSSLPALPSRHVPRSGQSCRGRCAEHCWERRWRPGEGWLARKQPYSSEGTWETRVKEQTFGWDFDLQKWHDELAEQRPSGRKTLGMSGLTQPRAAGPQVLGLVSLETRLKKVAGTRSWGCWALPSLR